MDSSYKKQGCFLWVFPYKSADKLCCMSRLQWSIRRGVNLHLTHNLITICHTILQWALQTQSKWQKQWYIACHVKSFIDQNATSVFKQPKACESTDEWSEPIPLFHQACCHTTDDVTLACCCLCKPSWHIKKKNFRFYKKADLNVNSAQSMWWDHSPYKQSFEPKGFTAFKR